MVEISLKKIGHILTLIMATVILVASKKFLLGNPLLSGGIILVFALVYGIFARLMSAKLFVYPATILFSIAYFLFAYKGAPIVPLLPVLSVPLLFFLLILAQKLKHDIYSRPLIHCQYLISFFFLGYLLINCKSYFLHYQMGAMITLFFYALFYQVRYRQIKRESGSNKNNLRYLSLLCLSFSALFLLYAVRFLPLQSYSFFLIFLFMIYMHIGARLSRLEKNKEAIPFYVTGFIGLLIAPFYALSGLNLIVLIQVIYSIHFWRMYRYNFPHQSRLWTNNNFYKVITNLPTLVFLGLFAYQRFPVEPFYLGIALLYAALYLAMGWRGELSFWKGRSLSTYTAGLFLNLAFFEGLFLIFPLQQIRWQLAFTILPLWVLFLVGYWGCQKGRFSFGRSMYEVQIVTLLISFFIPLLHQPVYLLDYILPVGFGYLVSEFLFMLISNERLFLYPVTFIFSFLYYDMLVMVSRGGDWISLAFLPAGALSLLLAVRFHRQGKRSSLFYFWGIMLTVFSLFTLRPGSAISLYGLALWSYLYLLGYLSIPKIRLQNVFLTIAHILALSCAAVLVYNRSIPAGIFTGLILAFGYAMVFFKSGKRRYLYPASMAFAVAWIIMFTSGRSWEVIHLYSLPLLVILYGLGLGFKQLREGFNPVKHTAHLTAFFLTLTLILSHGKVNPILALVSVSAYALLYLILARSFPVYDFVFLAASFISLSYYFGLFMVSSLSSGQRLLSFFFSAVALTVVGYLWKRKRGLEASWPLFDSALLIALVCSLIPLLRGVGGTAQAVMLMAALLYLFMAVQTKRDLYIYLTTLTLGLLAYHFLGLAHQTFTRDLLVYLLYLTCFLGIFFFIPFFKRFLQYQGPRYLFTAFSWKAVAFYSVVLVALGGVLLSAYSVEIASYPGFCTQCHFMKPYADAWRHSTHREVSCVKCHYEPGLEPTIKGKINGLVSVVKYVSGSYSIKPSAEVSDRSCLREGCHKKADLKKDITFKKDIKFNHEYHLRELRRGKKLRCTTCHSQIVQGEHITVTESICFTCHMKGAERSGVGIGKCTTCHPVPNYSVSYMGMEFNHKEFLANKPDLRCVDCHRQVTQGNGPVPKERCYSCHVEREKPADPQILHTIHITEHKVECFECHLDIKHGDTKMLREVSLNCQDCHTQLHSIPEKMLFGMGAMDLQGEPDPMFTAKVSCQGCHKYKEKVKVGNLSMTITTAKAKVCDECHGEGEGYSDMMKEWQASTRAAINRVSSLKNKLERSMKKAQRKGGRRKLNSPVWKDMKQAYDRARANLKFVTTDGSLGVHNINYTEDILNKVQTDLKTSLALLKSTTDHQFSEEKQEKKNKISEEKQKKNKISEEKQKKAPGHDKLVYRNSNIRARIISRLEGEIR